MSKLGVTEIRANVDDIEAELALISADFIGRLWRCLFWVALVATPLSVSRSLFTGWLPVYTIHIGLTVLTALVVRLRSHLSYRQQVNLYLAFLWAVGLPGLFTFGLAAPSIWWLVLSCFVASKAYSIRAGLYLAAGAGVVLAVAALGFISGWLRVQIDAHIYFSAIGAWANLLIATGAFVLTVMYSTAGHHKALMHLMQQVRRQHDHIQQLATHDALTGLPVLRLTTDRMQMAMARARRSGRKVALLFIDLDRFKRINDLHGHDAGDRVLQVVAERLQGLLRTEDTVSRIGGDEFVVALSDLADQTAACAVAAKIVESVSLPMDYNGRLVQVGVSIGISLFPDQAEDYPALRRLADQAMYAVKRRGRNGYALAGEPAQQTATRARLHRQNAA